MHFPLDLEVQVQVRPQTAAVRRCVQAEMNPFQVHCCFGMEAELAELLESKVGEMLGDWLTQ